MKRRGLLAILLLAGCADSLALATYAGPDGGAEPNDAGRGAPSLGDGSVPADASFDAAPNRCPVGPGPAMVQIDDRYCIDSTEVTIGQLTAFIDAGNPLPDSLPGSFSSANCTASVSPPPSEPPNVAVGHVSWCVAYVFCQWAGKRLCGATDGGMADFDAGFADATQDEWFNACTTGGENAYPYGSDYVADACNGAPAEGGGPNLAVGGAFSSCRPPNAPIYDLVGNVAEWESSCTPDFATCRLRGGSYAAGAADDLRCDSSQDDIPTSGRIQYGIRCCADVVDGGP